MDFARVLELLLVCGAFHRLILLNSVSGSPRHVRQADECILPPAPDRFDTCKGKNPLTPSHGYKSTVYCFEYYRCQWSPGHGLWLMYRYKCTPPQEFNEGSQTCTVQIQIIQCESIWTLTFDFFGSGTLAPTTVTPNPSSSTTTTTTATTTTGSTDATTGSTEATTGFTEATTPCNWISDPTCVPDCDVWPNCPCPDPPEPFCEEKRRILLASHMNIYTHRELRGQVVSD